jgi:hypothetical protein
MIRLASVYNGWIFKCTSNSMVYDGRDEAVITPSETGLYQYYASIGNPAGITDHIGIVHSAIVEGQNTFVDFLPINFVLHQNQSYINGICELIAGKRYHITTYVRNNNNNPDSRLVLVLYKLEKNYQQ